MAYNMSYLLNKYSVFSDCLGLVVSNELVRVNNVTFGYARRVILEDVTMSFQRGNVIAIMGGSGMGKTTLLKLQKNQTAKF